MIFTLTLNAAVDRVLSAPGFAPGGVCRVELAELLAAGKGFNVSRVLSELGVPSVAAGLVGAGESGFYAASFRRLGVETLLATFDAPTRTNVTILDPRTGGETHLRERGPEVPADLFARLGELLLPRLAAGDVLAFCGSLPPGAEPEALSGLLSAARARGARLFVDSSGPALAAAWSVRPDMLSVNAEELAELSGDARGAADSARRLAASGPEGCAVLVKLGAEGALALTAAGGFRAPAPKVAVRNTVGAGDAFNAGYLAHEGRGLSEALAMAVGCGSAQVASGALGRMSGAEAARLAASVRPSAISPATSGAFGG